MWEWFWSNLSNIDSIVSISTAVIGIMFPVGGVITGFVQIKLKHNQFRYLNLRMNEKQIKQSLKYFIPTKVQDLDPFESDESGTSLKKEIIPFFINTVFKESETQYYIILADSGMGKTTFMLKLFMQYYKKALKKYKIVFIPLNLRDSIEKILQIKKPSKTILLLDGFDEDSLAWEDYHTRLTDICNATQSFYKVIFTCRTQFFPNRMSEPKYLGKIKFGIGDKGVLFEKYYISPFSDSDIMKYLKKKYDRVLERNKIQRSKKLIDNCPHLMVRPMLLSYMDDLISDKSKKYRYTYEIYGELISKWIKRETTKNGINKEFYKFSEKVAEMMFLNKTEYISVSGIERLCKAYDIELNKIEAKSRSLLNRNANGLYKFAHKSILEYFLAQKAFNEQGFRKNIISNGFSGYDMTGFFLSEMDKVYLEMIFQEDDSMIRSFNYLYLLNANLEGIDLRGCEFIGCNFLRANLNEAKLCHTIFKNANFSNASLFDTDFNNANLQNANFDNASLTNTRLTNADLRGTNLYEANLYKVNISGSKFTEQDLQRILPKLVNTVFSYIRIESKNEYFKELTKEDLHIK